MWAMNCPLGNRTPALWNFQICPPSSKYPPSGPSFLVVGFATFSSAKKTIGGNQDSNASCPWNPEWDFVYLTHLISAKADNGAEIEKRKLQIINATILKSIWSTHLNQNEQQRFNYIVLHMM
jgi:hypothetical protein